MLDDNESALAGEKDALSRRCTRHASIEASREALAALALLLRGARRDEGWVRRCHGDLHLGNIVEIDGAPVLFDAIEFDDAHRHDRRALRSRLPADGSRQRGLRSRECVLNGYLDAKGEQGDLLGLPRCRCSCRLGR